MNNHFCLVLAFLLFTGVKLPNINILLPIDKIQIQSSKGEKTIKLAGR